MPLRPMAARADLHFWEEPCISGTNGSGTVFFSGCTLQCIYCQNHKISEEGFGRAISSERLAEIFRELEQKGAHNINLVSPTHFALSIKEALDIYRPNIPIVYNSSGYENTSTLKMLEGYIDIYLLDFKYISSQKAEEYSGAPDYPLVVKEALLECLRQKRECIFDKNGIMQSGIIVRHLLLPQSTKDAIEIFDWVRDNMKGSYFSIMSQYVPMHKAVAHKIISRPVTQREYQKVLNHIIESGFENCYVQELESASKAFVPAFDLKGI